VWQVVTTRVRRGYIYSKRIENELFCNMQRVREAAQALERTCGEGTRHVAFSTDVRSSQSRNLLQQCDQRHHGTTCHEFAAEIISAGPSFHRDCAGNIVPYRHQPQLASTKLWPVAFKLCQLPSFALLWPRVAEIFIPSTSSSIVRAQIAEKESGCGRDANRFVA
jgi:hypothetical protein